MRRLLCSWMGYKARRLGWERRLAHLALHLSKEPCFFFIGRRRDGKLACYLVQAPQVNDRTVPGLIKRIEICFVIGAVEYVRIVVEQAWHALGVEVDPWVLAMKRCRRVRSLQPPTPDFLKLFRRRLLCQPMHKDDRIFPHAPSSPPVHWKSAWAAPQNDRGAGPPSLMAFAMARA
ncbi:hypothetical protein D3C80_952270 [compost metagenome]